MTPQAREAYLYVRNLQSTAPTARVQFSFSVNSTWSEPSPPPEEPCSPAPTPQRRPRLPGYGDQREVELLVQAGFTPVEAVKIATLNGATYLNQQAHIGSIASGKDADLAAIKGDPSTKISDIENVEIVFNDGVGYDSAKLLDSIQGRYSQY